MTRIHVLLLSTIFSSFLLVHAPSTVSAGTLPPLTGAATAKKFLQFREKAGRDFLLPQVFQHHPGVTYILTHAKDLNLDTTQIARLRTIRRRMLDRSLRQIKEIDALRDKYLALATTPKPPVKKIRKMLLRLGELMATATSDHLGGHLLAGRVLTKEQWTTLVSLK